MLTDNDKALVTLMKDQVEAWLVEDDASDWWKWQHQYALAADRIEAQAAEIESLKTMIFATGEAAATNLRTAMERAAEIERLREALVTVCARIEDIENPFEDGTKQEHVAFEKAVDAASLIARAALGETE